MTAIELLELKIYALYFEFAAEHPVGTRVPESRELRSMWDRLEELYALEGVAD